MSTSRDDGTSGIRLYRVPVRPAWSDPGPGIEIIHHGWRYVMCWPLLHDETGAMYRWLNLATGNRLDGPPREADLPELPPAWVDHLARDQAGPDKADATYACPATSPWIKESARPPHQRQVVARLEKPQVAVAPAAARTCSSHLRVVHPSLPNRASRSRLVKECTR